jgi:DNA-binding GntR family transcriptional regulator
MRATDAENFDPLRDLVAALQEDIVLGRLPPGARLVEEELAGRFDTKRHVVRAAFGELERAGLIERKRNRGASVRQLTPDDVNQIYAVREILERGAAAQIALPLGRTLLAPIEAAQARHDRAVGAGDAKAVFRANFEFHEALFAACGNPYLARAIDDFRKKTHVVWSYAIVKPEYFRNAQREHRAMIKALKDGDRKRLVELCAAHLNISRAAYLETYRMRFPGEQKSDRGTARASTSTG